MIENKTETDIINGKYSDEIKTLWKHLIPSHT